MRNRKDHIVCHGLGPVTRFKIKAHENELVNGRKGENVFESMVLREPLLLLPRYAK